MLWKKSVSRKFLYWHQNMFVLLSSMDVQYSCLLSSSQYGNGYWLVHVYIYWNRCTLLLSFVIIRDSALDEQVGPIFIFGAGLSIQGPLSLFPFPPPRQLSVAILPCNSTCHSSVVPRMRTPLCQCNGILFLGLNQNGNWEPESDDGSFPVQLDPVDMTSTPTLTLCTAPGGTPLI